MMSNATINVGTNPQIMRDRIFEDFLGFFHRHEHAAFSSQNDDGGGVSSLRDRVADLPNTIDDTNIAGIFFSLQRQVSLRPRPNLETALFCYCAFEWGLSAYLATCSDPEDDGPLTSPLVPNYQELFQLAGYPEADLQSLFLFALWDLIGFSYTSARRRPILANVSRSLTISEFANGIPYEGVEDRPPTKCCVFVSHRWEEPEHPDPKGEQRNHITDVLRQIQEWLDALCGRTPPPVHFAATTTDENREDAQFDFMKALVSDELNWAIQFFVCDQDWVTVWYDYYSIPQGADDLSKQVRSRCLMEIEQICRNAIVYALLSDDYFTRGWCVFEMIQSKIGAPLGTKIWRPDETIELELYTEQRVRSIHGRFCGLLEDGNEGGALEPLEKIGTTCRNGSDMQFLSQKLQHESTGRRKAPLVAHVHPLLCALTKFLDRYCFDREKCAGKAMVLSQSMLHFCFKWQSEIEVAAMNGATEPVERLSNRVVFRWRHPDNCLQYLLETRLNWASDEFVEWVDQATSVLEAMALSSQTCPDRVELEDFQSGGCSQLIAQLELIRNRIGYFLEVSFRD